MSNLTLVNRNQLTLDSREVAMMVEKEHKNLLADVRKYEEFLTSSNVSPLSFFTESTYMDAKGEIRPNYQITKKGCEFIAHKLTGQKGAMFTATYINKFHEMEQTLQKPKAIQNETKEKEIEARLKNANTRQAKLLMQIASNIEIPEYKQVLNSYATEIITGKKLLPLPQVEEKTYTAKEIGEILGISANKVGRLANEHNLKTSEFGKLFYDKAKYTDKQVETFRYYENVIPILRNLGDINEIQ